MLDKTIYSAAPSYYHYYFDLVETNDLIKEMALNASEVEAFIHSVSEEKWNYAYAEGKWTVAQVLRHVIETERIFAYRAMRFSRFDATALPGFNENDYIAHLDSVAFSQSQILREFQTVREASKSLFETMTGEMLRFVGNANGLQVTAEMLGFMIVGHTRHHLKVLGERY
jgi:hypothetical protein